MTDRLNYLKTTRGIGLFTARSGMGKSYGLRCFAKQLNPNLGRMEYMCLSTVSVAEFYKTLCDILGVSDKGGKPGRFKAIKDQIYYIYKEKRRPLILAIDEAHHLNTAGCMSLSALRKTVTFFAMGTTVLIGHSVGARDRKMADRVLGNSVWLFAVLVVILTPTIPMF